VTGAPTGHRIAPMGKYGARVRWQVGIILVITVIWFAPLVWFNFQLVRHGRPLLTVAYVACALLSVSVIWLPEGYFRPRAFERSGRLYERLGVRFFRRFMLQGDYYNRALRSDDPAHRVITGRASANRYDAQTRAAERGHLISLIVGAVITAYGLCLGFFHFAVLFTASNAIFNVYPIMLQRYTRARIDRIRCR
jgi:Glycosyl-4,4'-diaponeurosporenoate acyltransferase